MTSGSEPVTSAPPQPGRQRRWRPPAFVTVWAAVGLAVAAAVIAVNTVTHQPRAAPAPRPAPALSLPSLLYPAQRVTLSAYQGRPVIVNFFASWCLPCQKETPLLARFYTSRRGAVSIIGVDADDNAPAARVFLAAKGVRYPVGYETTPALSDAYGVSGPGIPETFFLDARHRIVKRVLGGVTMRDLTAGVALMDRPR